jgi:hypothetical protein
MMTNRAADRGASDSVVSSQMTHDRPGRCARQASGLSATDQPETDDERND